MVEDTIDDLYFWSNAVTLLMLCGLAALVLLQWRAADKREGPVLPHDAHDGLLVRLSALQAEIQSQTLPPKFTDLKLLLDITSVTNGIYGKVVGQSAVNGSFVLHFTAIPPEARKYFFSLEPAPRG